MVCLQIVPAGRDFFSAGSRVQSHSCENSRLVGSSFVDGTVAPVSGTTSRFGRGVLRKRFGSRGTESRLTAEMAIPRMSFETGNTAVLISDKVSVGCRGRRFMSGCSGVRCALFIRKRFIRKRFIRKRLCHVRPNCTHSVGCCDGAALGCRDAPFVSCSLRL